MLQLAFVNFKPNSYILVEGTPGIDRFFIIQSGKVSVYREGSATGTAPTTLGPGDFVGVIPCMSGHSQVENVVALTDVVVIMVRRDQYPELIMRNTPVAMKIVRAFAKEMRTLNDDLTKITFNKNSSESPEQLFSVAKYYQNLSSYDIAIYAYYQYLKECPNGVHIEEAKKRFVQLKKDTHAVYFESNSDLIRDYPVNTMIFSEHQKGGDMFIIQEGSVKISKVVDGEEVALALLKKGDMFGEMALLEDKPRSASAIAHSPCKLMVINKDNFDQMVASQSQMIARLTTMLADRIWSMYRQLANSTLKNPREKMIDMLALQIEKQKTVIGKGMPYQTDISVDDLINLCGISQHDKATARAEIYNDPNVKISYGKITIPDVPELIKQAAFYRKQNKKAKK
ncbi:MAG: cyclic nucleotide-binding domain-containing protein [Treponema sp.]|nr:cyclic nucleotide-binding domain-containing protein [Treponema sp.]HAK68247.1 cAMP-binding protein [Treponema sp.]